MEDVVCAVEPSPFLLKLKGNYSSSIHTVLPAGEQWPKLAWYHGNAHVQVNLKSSLDSCILCSHLAWRSWFKNIIKILNLLKALSSQIWQHPHLGHWIMLSDYSQEEDIFGQEVDVTMWCCRGRMAIRRCNELLACPQNSNGNCWICSDLRSDCIYTTETLQAYWSVKWCRKWMQTDLIANSKMTPLQRCQS